MGDSDEWTMLSVHDFDDSIKGISGAFTWELKKSIGNKFFNQFRIRMTGVNSSDNMFLCCSGFELYGDIRGSAKLAKNVTEEEKKQRLILQQEHEKRVALIEKVRA